VAIIPTVIITILYGARGTGKLIILSQVILSLQLSFAVFPLVAFTSDRRKMGEFVNARWLKYLSYVVAVFHRRIEISGSWSRSSAVTDLTFVSWITKSYPLREISNNSCIELYSSSASEKIR